MKSQQEIIDILLKNIEGEPISFISLCRQSGFSYRTVRKYLELISYLQEKNNRIEISRDGFRVLIKRPDNPKPISTP